MAWGWSKGRSCLYLRSNFSIMKGNIHINRGGLPLNDMSEQHCYVVLVGFCLGELASVLFFKAAQSHWTCSFSKSLDSSLLPTICGRNALTWINELKSSQFCKGRKPKKEMHWIIIRELWLSSEPWWCQEMQTVNLRKLPQQLREAAQVEQPYGSRGEKRERSDIECSNFLLFPITANNNYCHPYMLLLVSLVLSSKSSHCLLYLKTQGLTAL